MGSLQSRLSVGQRCSDLLWQTWLASLVEVHPDRGQPERRKCHTRHEKRFSDRNDMPCPVGEKMSSSEELLPCVRDEEENSAGQLAPATAPYFQPGLCMNSRHRSSRAH